MPCIFLAKAFCWSALGTVKGSFLHCAYFMWFNLHYSTTGFYVNTLKKCLLLRRGGSSSSRIAAACSVQPKLVHSADLHRQALTRACSCYKTGRVSQLFPKVYAPGNIPCLLSPDKWFSTFFSICQSLKIPKEVWTSVGQVDFLFLVFIHGLKNNSWTLGISHPMGWELQY